MSKFTNLWNAAAAEHKESDVRLSAAADFSQWLRSALDDACSSEHDDGVLPPLSQDQQGKVANFLDHFSVQTMIHSEPGLPDLVEHDDVLSAFQNFTQKIVYASKGGKLNTPLDLTKQISNVFGSIGDWVSDPQKLAFKDAALAALKEHDIIQHLPVASEYEADKLQEVERVFSNWAKNSSHPDEDVQNVIREALIKVVEHVNTRRHGLQQNGDADHEDPSHELVLSDRLAWSHVSETLSATINNKNGYLSLDTMLKDQLLDKRPDLALDLNIMPSIDSDATDAQRRQAVDLHSLRVIDKWAETMPFETLDFAREDFRNQIIAAIDRVEEGKPINEQLINYHFAQIGFGDTAIKHCAMIRETLHVIQAEAFAQNGIDLDPDFSVVPIAAEMPNASQHVAPNQEECVEEIQDGLSIVIKDPIMQNDFLLKVKEGIVEPNEQSVLAALSDLNLDAGLDPDYVDVIVGLVEEYLELIQDSHPQMLDPTP